MKRSTLGVMIALFTAFTLGTALAQSQSQPPSLGDFARKQRQKKYEHPVATKVYTNDNLPFDTSMKDGGGETANTPDCADCAKPADISDANPGDKSANDSDKAASGKPAPGSVEEFKQRAAEWKKKVDDQKKIVAALEQQLKSLQEQYRLRASAYYSDAGLRLRDGGAKWAQDEVEFRKTIDDKQKELDAAKQKLADVQDAGHRAGAPNSVLE